MTTREIVEMYFDQVKAKHGWDVSLSDDIHFTIFTSPVERVTDRGAVLERLKRFYSMVNTVEIRDIIVNEARACALVRYELQPPRGPAFESHVAEVFEVQGDHITSFDIYFDSAPFPK